MEPLNKEDFDYFFEPILTALVEETDDDIEVIDNCYFVEYTNRGGLNGLTKYFEECATQLHDGGCKEMAAAYRCAIKELKRTWKQILKNM